MESRIRRRGLWLQAASWGRVALAALVAAALVLGVAPSAQASVNKAATRPQTHHRRTRALLTLTARPAWTWFGSAHNPLPTSGATA
jgi:hypothetical protein